MSLPEDKAWFPAKRHGYGWGLPTRWQGWVVFAGYLAGLIVPNFFLRSGRSALGYVAYAIVLSTVLVAICSWKGVKPRWRWGDEEKPGRPRTDPR